MRLEALLLLSVEALLACSSGDGDGDGGGTSSSTAAGTTSSITAASQSSTGTGAGGGLTQEECEALTPPDCGPQPALVYGCGVATGLSFPADTGACSVPSVSCDGAEPFEACMWLKPNTLFAQSPCLVSRTRDGFVEIVEMSVTPPQEALPGWTVQCIPAPECPGWEYWQ